MRDDEQGSCQQSLRSSGQYEGDPKSNMSVRVTEGGLTNMARSTINKQI